MLGRAAFPSSEGLDTGSLTDQADELQRDGAPVFIGIGGRVAGLLRPGRKNTAADPWPPCVPRTSRW